MGYTDARAPQTPAYTNHFDAAAGATDHTGRRATTNGEERVDAAPSVRAANANEVVRLSSFFSSTLSEVGAAWREERTANIEDVSALAKQGKFVVLDSTCGSELLGAFHMICENGQMRVQMLAVSPTSHRRGIGRRLLDIAESFASALGCAQVVVDLRGTSQELRRWYQRLGYVDYGTQLAKTLATVS